MPTETILDTIMAHKRSEVASRKRSVPESRLLERAASVPPTRGFATALKGRVEQGMPGIIAEVKQGSPSKGRIYPKDLILDPGTIAKGYADHGAACISCLTDSRFFQGDDTYIGQIRDRIDKPVLRKDFLYDPYQVVEARALGADAILLIMAVLTREQALELEAAALEMGLDVLVEVHDAHELEEAHNLKTPLMGINNRNLKTFETTLQTSIDLARMAEERRLIVSESGIAGADDMARLREEGIHAFLIGEAFMRHAEPGEALGRFLKGERA